VQCSCSAPDRVKHDDSGPTTSGRQEQIIVDRRRAMMLMSAGLMGLSHGPLTQQASAEVYNFEDTDSELDMTITHRVVLSIGIAPRSFKTAGERTLGDLSVIPLDDAAPVGQIMLGLYGRLAPGTVSNFLSLVSTGVLEGTVFSRVLSGEYIQAGQQGAYRMGQVEGAKADLQANPDLSSSASFKARHMRPGTLSLSLSENDEDPAVKGRPGYRQSEFLITTGPGPVPRLDGANVVFGRVLEGMGVVGTIAKVPTFKPSQRSEQLNMFASSIGDERAAGVRRKYGKPLKAVIIQKAEQVPLTEEEANILAFVIARDARKDAVSALPAAVDL